jgi:ketosteroid isomerase-like protein
MPSLTETLLGMERRLAAGDGDTYREVLLDDAIVVVPGMVLDKEACAAAIDAAGRWGETTLDDPALVQPTADVAVLTYRFTGRRGSADPYVAVMTSVYARRDETWRLVLHQQTPLPND